MVLQMEQHPDLIDYLECFYRMIFVLMDIYLLLLFSMAYLIHGNKFSTKFLVGPFRIISSIPSMIYEYIHRHLLQNAFTSL